MKYMQKISIKYHKIPKFLRFLYQSIDYFLHFEIHPWTANPGEEQINALKQEKHQDISNNPSIEHQIYIISESIRVARVFADVIIDELSLNKTQCYCQYRNNESNFAPYKLFGLIVMEELFNRNIIVLNISHFLCTVHSNHHNHI